MPCEQEPLRRRCGAALYNYQLIREMHAEVVKNSVERTRPP